MPPAKSKGRLEADISDAGARLDSERPTIVALPGDASAAAPIDELPVPSGRVLHSVTSEADAIDLRDVEEPARPCALSGRILDAGALCDIVSFVAQATWRGELVVRDELTPQARSLFFDEGHVVAAESTAPSERLGEVLSSRGVLSREQVTACVELTAEGKHRFGEAAVALGFITREALFEAMALQIEAIFFEVLRVERGSFAFFHGYEEARLSFRRKHEVDVLLTRALAQMDDARYFRSRVPSSGHVPMRTPGRTEPPRDPLGIYAAIDGSRTVTELAAAIGSNEFDVTRALFQHVHTGHARLEPPRLTAREILDIYNKAILVLLRELDAMDEGDAVRVDLARFAERGADRPDVVDTPAEDGTLDAESIARRIETLDDPAIATDRLARWLYDYASYALFLARPHLQRRDERHGDARVSRRVADMLQPIAPRGNPTMPAAQGAPRVTVPAPSARSDVMPSGSIPAGLMRTADGGPTPTSSTVRMRRVLPGEIPGLDPSRTIRMAPFAVPAATPPAPASMPISVTEPAATTSADKPQPAATPRTTTTTPAVGEARPSRVPLAIVTIAVALLGGAALGWQAHRSTSKAEQPDQTPALTASTPAVSAPSPAPEPPVAHPRNTEIVVVCEPQCGAVYLDGRQLASSSEAISVTAGAHDIVVRRPGYASDYRRVSVAEGESRAVTFQLTPGTRGRAK